MITLRNRIRVQFIYFQSLLQNVVQQLYKKQKDFYQPSNHTIYNLLLLTILTTVVKKNDEDFEY